MSLQKLWAIAWKELYTTFRDRNLILLMFVTPIILSTIIGLAFGGLGSDTPTIGTIDVAVVNLDDGLDVGSLVMGTVDSGAVVSGAGVTNTGILTSVPGDFSFNLGEIVTGILLGEAITATGAVSGTNLTLSESFSCTLVSGEEPTVADQGSLEELLNATELIDAATARLGVEQGGYAAAVIIPPGFTQTILPSFGPMDSNGSIDNAITSPTTLPQIEVYGNSGDTLSAGIVNSIVTGIVSQFARLPVTLEATVDTMANSNVLDNIDLDALETTLESLQIAANTGNFDDVDTSLFSGTGTVTDTFALLGCLFTPGINPVSLEQQPLDTLQEGNNFSRVLVIAGSAQAVFFALFTGVFGILSIYEERKQWTLQRMIASPTSSNTILLGKLLGNLVTVITQLLLLMLALTTIASLVLGEPTSIWGTQVGLLFVMIVVLSLTVSGIGVLVVGLARTPEQVQILGPVVNMTLGVFGSAFGFALPEPLPRLSLITWGTDAFEKLAGGQLDIGFNLLVLLAQGVLFFVVGSWLFRRRLNL